ncbi:hypothetical protein [Kribbella deserti]|uniref:Uncharacterized protein n=1 Tax=Kribbella deserti TaxID=1926257 RepID=A0ABV6QR43_9ACTN
MDLDDFDDEDNDDEDDEDEEAAGPVLSGLLRSDFTVTDQAALVSAGRDAYRSLWPSDTDEDAALAVPDIIRAAAEIVHASGWSGLANAPGLEPHAEWNTFVSHDGQSDTSDDEDPFAIARPQAPL